MARLLPPSILAPLLQDDPGLVDQALATIYNGWEFQHTLETLSDAARISGQNLAGILSDTLDHDDVDQQFLSILRARGTDLLPPAGFTPADFEEVENDTVDPDALRAFNSTARTSRCRIVVGDKVMGSGALISRRLVLTAAHVIREGSPRASGLRNKSGHIQVRGADGKNYPAWLEFISPVHDNELNDLPAPDEAYETHADVALLRIYKPLGRKNKFGHFDVTRPLPTAIGRQQLWLVHFPDGQDRGYSIGRYQRDGGRMMYLKHDAETNGGSSGGVAFDGDFTFIGHHQGGLGKDARIVPFERYVKNPDFQKALANDTPPDYLWSLDESIDSHMIIGRETFFDALTAMIEGTAVALKGVWVRRMDTSLDTGLAFTHTILNAFLQAHDSAATTYRISLDLVSEDLLGDIGAQVLGTMAAPRAASGVQAGETSLAATDKDRAKALAATLQHRAAKASQTHWFYFDNPPSGLSRTAQVQLEHLVAELLIRPDLRVVLSGYETFSLADRLFETIMEARDHGPPGLLVEFIGEFTKEDLRQTITAMNADLGIGWSPGVIDYIMRIALAGIHSVAGAFPAKASAMVAKRLREEVRQMQGLR